MSASVSSSVLTRLSIKEIPASVHTPDYFSSDVKCLKMAPPHSTPHSATPIKQNLNKIQTKKADVI